MSLMNSFLFECFFPHLTPRMGFKRRVAREEMDIVDIEVLIVTRDNGHCLL